MSTETPAQTDDILRVEHISKRYGAVTALVDVNLRLERGEVLALVGERTVPVARLVAGKLRTAPLPLRLCYAGPVLSTDDSRFQQRRETYQVGAELVGASGPVADAEVIALAARCLA